MNDLPVGRSVDETLRLVQAFQFTDENGEVCPAGWKPGQDTVSICLNHLSVLLNGACIALIEEIFVGFFVRDPGSCNVVAHIKDWLSDYSVYTGVP